MSTDGPVLTETHIKRLLAYRIQRHAEQGADAVREALKEAYSVPDLQSKTTALAESLAAIEELQEVWERLFDETPSAFDVAVIAAQHKG